MLDSSHPYNKRMTTSTSIRVNPRRAMGVAIAKAARTSARQLGRGGGTSLPGLIAQRFDPNIVADLAGQIPRGVVLVSGTNGKTTTSRMLRAMLLAAGLQPLHNSEGANLERGLATTLITHTDALGCLQTTRSSIGLFEVDEGILPVFLDRMQPRVILLTNILRDQLDRYIEIDYLAELWRRRFVNLTSATTLVVNGDDPLLTELASKVESCSKIFFGIEDPTAGQTELEHASDSRRCLRCGTDFEYSQTFYGHLGHYRCPGCGFIRPHVDVAAENIQLNGLEGGRVDIRDGEQAVTVEVPLPGLHNVYNALAALAAAKALDLDLATIAPAIGTATSAFGRVERVTVDGKELVILLVKNPSGYNQVIRTLLDGTEPKRLMVALNDNQMDGRDVSWIWDVEFELLRGKVAAVVTSGLRAHDLALRLKHADWFIANPLEAAPSLSIEVDVIWALEMALAQTPRGQQLYLLTTYTPMWELREHLRKRGLVGAFYE